MSKLKQPMYLLVAFYTFAVPVTLLFASTASIAGMAVATFASLGLLTFASLLHTKFGRADDANAMLYLVLLVLGAAFAACFIPPSLCRIAHYPLSWLQVLYVGVQQSLYFCALAYMGEKEAV